MSLTLIGLGIDRGDLSFAAFDALKGADVVFLRTENTRSATFLKENGIKYSSFDSFYVKSRTFLSLEKKIISCVKKETKTGKNVVYAVDGAVSEDRAAATLAHLKGVKIFEGASKVGNALSRCGLNANGYTALSAYQNELRDFSFPLVVFDLDSRILASKWKLFLADKIGEELPVKLLIGGDIKKIPVYEMDRFDGYDYSTVLIVEKHSLTEKERFKVEDLFDILYVLRSPDGCPWDKAQSPETILKNMIEEAYELVDAVKSGDDDKVREEIGDVLMQAAFHTVFAEERGAFDRTDVVTELCRKLISRHTHVFGKDKATDGAAALEVWDKNKQKEKGYEGAFDYVSAIPKVFPACMRAEKTFKRSNKSGIILPDLSADKIYELAAKYLAEKKEEAAGKLLYYVVSLVAAGGLSAEETLAAFIDGYLEKMNAVESAFKKENGKAIFDRVDLEKAYDEIKKP